jgi:hypothetical protein
MGVTWDSGEGSRLSLRAFLRQARRLKNATVSPSPYFHVGTLPHLAHVEFDLGHGEILAVNELLDPLATDAEHPADLSRTHKVMHSGNHSQHDTCHLTTGQECGRLVT